MSRRVVPRSLEAEASMLGGILLRNSVMAELREHEPDDFYDPKHKLVFTAMRSLEAAARPIDIVTLEAELSRMGSLDAVGGIGYLSDLSVRVPTAENAAHYARIVREKRAARDLMLAASEIAAKGYEDYGDLQDYLDEAEDRILTVTKRSSSAGGGQWESSGQRVQGEAERRKGLVARAIPYPASFLQDYLLGILPHDLVLIGAETGAGKTQLASAIAHSAVAAGRRVHFFALEAEPDEIERRLKFSLMSELIAWKELTDRDKARWSYAAWYMGHVDDLARGVDQLAEKRLATEIAGLRTFYRGEQFDRRQLERMLDQCTATDLIILDHLHYVDTDDEREENRAVSRIMRRLRSFALRAGVPVVCVVHLRKADGRAPRLVPRIGEIHGTSNIAKVATSVVLLARADNRPARNPWIQNTYMAVEKSRLRGRCPLVAMVGYDRRRNLYHNRYGLGWVDFSGTEVDFIGPEDEPAWAAHHSPIVDET